MSEKILDVIDIIPKEAVIGSNIRKIDIEHHNDGIRISYTNPKGSNPKLFVFPLTIEITEKLAEAIGLFVGDGSLKGNQSHTTFSNKDNELVKTVLNLFRDLGVIEDDITFIIHYREGEEDRSDILPRINSGASRS